MPRKKASSVRPGDIVLTPYGWLLVEATRKLSGGDEAPDQVEIKGRDDHDRVCYVPLAPGKPLALAPRDVVDEWPQ